MIANHELVKSYLTQLIEDFLAAVHSLFEKKPV